MMVASKNKLGRVSDCDNKSIKKPDCTFRTYVLITFRDTSVKKGILSAALGFGALTTGVAASLKCCSTFSKKGRLHNMHIILCYHRIAVSAKTGLADSARFPTVTFTLHLGRQPLYYVINQVIPCGLLSCIALSTFLLQPGCHERPALGN